MQNVYLDDKFGGEVSKNPADLPNKIPKDPSAIPMPTPDQNGGGSDYNYSFSDLNFMDYDEALRQARGILDPQFNRAKENTLGNLAQEQIGRGFYGQAPGDAITQQAVADLSAQYLGTLSQSAQGIMQNDFSKQMQMAQYELGKNEFMFNKDYKEDYLDFQQDQLEWNQDFQQDQFAWEKESFERGLQHDKDMQEYQYEMEQERQEQQNKSSGWQLLGNFLMILPFL